MPYGTIAVRQFIPHMKDIQYPYKTTVNFIVKLTILHHVAQERYKWLHVMDMFHVDITLPGLKAIIMSNC